MKKEQLTPKFLKQRRFLTLLPALILPFITILFSLAGGGKGSLLAAETAKTGLNSSLPQPQLARLSLADKLGYYENAEKDSANLAERMKYDPYPNQTGSDQSISVLGASGSQLSYGNDSRLAEEKIYQKLQQLNQVISQPAPLDRSPVSDQRGEQMDRLAPLASTDIDRLQGMIQSMRSSDQGDPELTQLGTLLEKIQQIQQPGLIQDRSKPAAPPSGIYQTVPAVIARDQKITEGTVVELRLLDSIRLGAQLIPKGHQLYATAQLQNQRMQLHITTIGLGRSILPVDLTAFDQRDSMLGIYVPELITNQAIRGGADDALQGMQVLGMNQGVTTQLAGAGINAAKGLFSKKIKPLKGKLSAGYPLLLRNNQQ